MSVIDHPDLPGFLPIRRPDTVISTVSLDTLIRMKEAAGRPRDLEDVRHLKMIRALRDKEGPGGR